MAKPAGPLNSPNGLLRRAPLFVRAGFQVMPAPTAFTAWSESALLGLLPSAGGLEAAYWACHEWLGRMQQRWVKQGLARRRGVPWASKQDHRGEDAAPTLCNKSARRRGALS